MEFKSIPSRYFVVRALAAFGLSALGMVPKESWSQPSNGVLIEKWLNITGSSVSNLTSNANYPANPSSRTYSTVYEIPNGSGDNYGTRTRGYITPPTTGNYTFWISSDDNSELWLGTSSDSTSGRLIASVTGWTNSREWTKFSTQQSASIALTAGTRYFIETRHKEGTGGDHMSVGWQGPGITGEAERPIPASRLTPFVPVGNTLVYERYDGISGMAVADLVASPSFPNSPNFRSNVAGFEIPVNVGENYGSRTRGFITPPTTGSYTFWIASDDNSELWLGTNDQPSTARVIASVPQWTNAREWTKYSQQQSAAISLNAGTRYYIEARQKEATGNDHLSVGWQGPGITGETERPIPSTRLSPPPNSVAPTISVQPQSQTIFAGQNVTFSVTASGTGPLTYAWYRNDVLEVSGVDRTSLPLLNVGESVNGARFRVAISNSAGTANSTTAILTVNPSAPVFTTQPVSQAVNVGQTATFSTALYGSTPLTYSWRKNGIVLPGETGTTLVTPPATAGDNGAQFTLTATNSLGSQISAIATLTVNTPPVITTQPANQTVTLGSVANFSVVATGSTPLTYQWRKNGVVLSGTNSPNYTTPATVSGDNGATYTVEVTNAFGSATSSSATLSVVASPVIVTQPANRTVNLGQTAAFSVTATGSGLSYQWRKNGTAINGATASTYTTPITTASDNGATFSVVVSNSAGNVTSNNAVLTVVIPPAITTQPANTVVQSGAWAGFSVVASGTAPLNYQWYKNAILIPGATSSTYATPPTVPGDNGAAFTVQVSNAAGNVTSNPAILTVLYVTPNNQKIAISGELFDAAGLPVGSPNPVVVDVYVRLYAADVGTTELYTERFTFADGKGVRVSQGFFVVRLGEGITSNNLKNVIAANSHLWVEITVDDGTPDVLVPRTPLTSAAYTQATAAATLSTNQGFVGAGNPNAVGIEAPVGSTYVNTVDNTTWFRLSTGWKLMD
jgi:PA14 domain/Immunoglobulin domain/Immunoglobulin I-set domain